jgi:hypothetical protein
VDWGFELDAELVKLEWLMTIICVLKKNWSMYRICQKKSNCPKDLDLHLFTCPIKIEILRAVALFWHTLGTSLHKTAGTCFPCTLVDRRLSHVQTAYIVHGWYWSRNRDLFELN